MMTRQVGCSRSCGELILGGLLPIFFLFLIIFIPKLISILLDVLFQYLDSKLGTIEFGAIGYGAELCRGSNEQGLYGR